MLPSHRQVMALPGGFPGLCAGPILAGIGSSVQHPRASLLVTSTYGNASRGPLGVYNFAGDLGKAGFPAVVALLLPVVAWRPVVATEAITALVIAATLLLPLAPLLAVLPLLGMVLNGTSSVLYPLFVEEPGRFTVVIPAYRPEPEPVRAASGERAERREGLILVSIGETSIRAAVLDSLEPLGLLGSEILVDYAFPGYVDTAADWHSRAGEIRDLLRQRLDSPAHQSFHLFYRGPVVLAPLCGALVPRAKSLTMYYYQKGSYHLAFTIDERFRKSTTK